MNERKIIEYINSQVDEPIKIMEVCGTHTHEMKRFGLESILSPKIELISGPGCPVCVTSKELIDAAIELANSGKTIITFGDMVRVKGSEYCLLDTVPNGGKIKVVYSPLDLFPLIEEKQDRDFVFFGVGFETTAPVIASVVKSVKQLRLKNISFLLSVKRMEPILKLILQSQHKIDGIIAPGHVATITGSNYFRFITEDFHVSCCVCGFSPMDILSSIYFLIRHCDESQFVNLYSRVVKNEGNKKALQLINEIFKITSEAWRGIGDVKHSAFQLKEKYADYDALEKYHLTLKQKENDADKCRCSEVILGTKKPSECPQFRKRCHPYNPMGPCMASHEGTCLAEYKYGGDYGTNNTSSR